MEKRDRHFIIKETSDQTVASTRHNRTNSNANFHTTKMRRKEKKRKKLNKKKVWRLKKTTKRGTSKQLNTLRYIQWHLWHTSWTTAQTPKYTETAIKHPQAWIQERLLLCAIVWPPRPMLLLPPPLPPPPPPPMAFALYCIQPLYYTHMHRHRHGHSTGYNRWDKLNRSRGEYFVKFCRVATK